MPTESIRTQEGFKNLLINGSGLGVTLVAADAPATIPEDAQVVTLDNTGGLATAVFTLPSPADYVGAGLGLIVMINADTAPEDVTVQAPAGVDIRIPTGAATASVVTSVSVDENNIFYFYKISATRWGLNFIAV